LLLDVHARFCYNITMLRTREDIQRIGFQVIATTTHSYGVSYDAHYVAGKRYLVRGPVENTPVQAMEGLYRACVERL
jgi:hypothetical protein